MALTKPECERLEPVKIGQQRVDHGVADEVDARVLDSATTALLPASPAPVTSGTCSLPAIATRSPLSYAFLVAACKGPACP